MNGVEVLASNKIIADKAFSWPIFVIALGAVIVLSIIIGFLITVTNNMDWDGLRIGIIVGLLFNWVFAIPFGFIFGTPVAYETQYKVIISDEVQMNCFLEKYDILDQEGRIYTVREKQLNQNFKEQ
jgi:hypothetical protein